jgi:hypothetical protein
MGTSLKRLWLWSRLVGRVTPAGVGRLGPGLAWAVVMILTSEKRPCPPGQRSRR